MGKGRIFSDDELPEYCQSVVIEDQHGRIKQLILPKALDLDRPKRARTWFTASQLEVLESEYRRNPYITGQDRKDLAKRLTLSETQVKVWFQNRRTKSKKEKSQELNTANDNTRLFNNHSSSSVQGLIPTNLFNKTEIGSNTPDLSYNRPWTNEVVDRNIPHATVLPTLLPFQYQQQQQALSWLLLSHNNLPTKFWMTQQDSGPKDDALDSKSSINEDKLEQDVTFFGRQQLNKQSLLSHFSSQIDPSKVSAMAEMGQDCESDEEIVVN